MRNESVNAEKKKEIYEFDGVASGFCGRPSLRFRKILKNGKHF